MQKNSPMPNFYVSPHQLPLHWQDEQTGILPAAVKAYFAHSLDKKKPFQGAQFALVRNYLRYYINAPCWQQGEERQIDALRASVQGLKTPEEMNAWINRCLDCGIDPL